MCVIDHAASAVCGLHADSVVHDMRGEFRGGFAVHQPPDHAIGTARFVHLDDADVLDRRSGDIMHIRTRPGYEEVSVRQGRFAEA